MCSGRHRTEGTVVAAELNTARAGAGSITAGRECGVPHPLNHAGQDWAAGAK